MTFKKNIATLLTAATILSSNISCSKDNYNSFMDYLRNDKKTNELIQIEKMNHDALQLESSFDENRKTNYVWTFCSLNKIPTKNKKLPYLADKENYHFAKGIPNAIYYLSSDTAVVGIKSYEQKIDASVDEFEYSVERFYYDSLSEDFSWTKVKDLYQVKTESCTKGDDCIDGERIISTHERGSINRTIDNAYDGAKKIWNNLISDWKKK